jgi:hypothetical protein
VIRAESVGNIPLFAGFPGFGPKLWLTDERTGAYHGIYEWDGAPPARSCARTLATLLGLVSVPGSVRWHVEPGIGRDEFLCDRGWAWMRPARIGGPS